MRFIANGPSIPDELLLARDQGRVVFFCGAGVSRAKANLPDFFELAAFVTSALGVQQDDPAMKIIVEAKELVKRTGVDGLISADRIFGLLERDFLSRDIQEAVAKALTLKSLPDLSAHQTLLRLATTREGLVRLVTTNFDRLFDCCRPNLPTYIHPNLPDPSHATDFNGTVYLHGKINSEGNGAEGEGFVLSSSEFGRAYLSDGWATSFVREILDRYFVIFIGYSADDPPLQYLLEALNKTSGLIEGVYAFQPGDSNYANSKWRHKGVTAIAYDGADGHAALWDTLDAWAVRADDPEAWIDNVVNNAKSGPEDAQPHERGQVAHVVSTVEGLRRFSEGGNPPPATWLCVFDPNQRYAKPGKQGKFGEDGIFIDPFDIFSLDSDYIPEKIDPDNNNGKRETPNGAWDALVLNSLDRAGLRNENVGSIRGHFARQSLRLPPRQFQFGAWISKVAKQPAAVWWAVRQRGLHPDIRNQIAWELERSKSETPAAVREAWRYLFDYWSEDSSDWHSLTSEIETSGWTAIIFRRFANIGKPYITVRENWGSVIPDMVEALRLEDLISLDVEYIDPPQDISIPDEWIFRAVVSLRRNLEAALELENEIGGYSLRNICPITPDDDSDSDSYARNHGLSAWLLFFISQLQRLMLFDIEAAKAELSKWPSDDITIFARLRIWALGQKDLVASEQFNYILAQLTDEAFWDSNHARDLLLAISSRWADLDAETKNEIEQRVLQGPKRWEAEVDQQFSERKAWSILNIINWMHEQGCKLNLDVKKVTNDLNKYAPEWQPEFAKSAAKSFECKSGWVRTETEHSALLQEPLKTTLAKAKKLSGRKGIDLVSFDPFSGLSQNRPVRAFAVLRFAAKRGEMPEWAWRSFLNQECRKNDQSKFTAFIGEVILRFPSVEIAGIVRPFSDWIQKSAKVLATEYPDIFSKLILKAIDVLSLQTIEANTSIIRGKKEADWTMEAINSPTGSIAQALFDDPKKDNLEYMQGFPYEWLRYVEGLLALSGDLHRHALVIFSRNLSWFFYIDPIWTQTHLLSILSSNGDQDEQALWAGFLWGGKAHGREFFANIKPHMLRMAKTGNLERRGYAETLTALILSAWAIFDEDTSERWLSNEELRDVLINSNDDLRSHFLWHAERWVKEDRDKWSPLLIELLSKVWPRQIAAKSVAISARLCNIAFSDEKSFPELAAIILPLLTKLDRDHLMLPNVRRARDNIVDLYPNEALALLHAVLPDNVTAWPYGIDATIDRIGEANNAIKRDERFIELKRKWDAR